MCKNMIEDTYSLLASNRLSVVKGRPHLATTQMLQEAFRLPSLPD